MEKKSCKPVFPRTHISYLSFAYIFIDSNNYCQQRNIFYLLRTVAIFVGFHCGGQFKVRLFFCLCVVPQKRIARQNPIRKRSE